MIDLTGQIFGDLTALEATLRRQNGNVVWLCVCVCGNQTEVNANKLRFGVTKSCGCRSGRVTAERNKASAKHGHAKTRAPSPTYRAWRSMIARCEDQSHRAYKFYGGRGIRVDRRWREDFRVFLQDMGERPAGCTLDRKEALLGYAPENCRWLSTAEQAKNTRATVRLTVQGETLILSDWARRLGVRPNVIRMRLQRGWSVETAVTTPMKAYQQRKTVNPVPLEVRQEKSAFKHRYRHLYRSPSDDLTFEEWQRILEMAGRRCRYCGKPDAETMDHVMPLSKGGPHTALNVVPACRRCNSSKKSGD